ncbi:uncharacterized protein LOC142355297 [Convolutriloba macropyga]|uniref:uncharacterized protein LOC142355297 n=1 Tax=Convolutriloba macropyga TaxID=536237 RepID=UPI003F521103
MSFHRVASESQNMNGLLVFFDQQLFRRTYDTENVTKNILDGLVFNGGLNGQEVPAEAELVIDDETWAKILLIKSSNLWWSIERTEGRPQRHSLRSRFADFICDNRYADSHVLIQVSPLKSGVENYCLGEDRQVGRVCNLEVTSNSIREAFENLTSPCRHTTHEGSIVATTISSENEQDRNRLCCHISKMVEFVTGSDTNVRCGSRESSAEQIERPESLSVHYSGYLGSKAELKDSHNTGERKKLIARLIKNALHNLSINERSNTAAGISTNQVFERVHGVKLMKTSLELCKRFTNLQPTKYLLHHSFAVIDSDNWYWSIEHDQHYIQIQRSREIDNIQYYRSGIARKTNRCDRIRAAHYKQVARSDIGTKTMKGYFDFIGKRRSKLCAVNQDAEQNQTSSAQIVELQKYKF